MKIKDIMEKDFVSFHIDDKLERIIKIFAENHIDSAPVFDKDEFIGIVSDTELVKYFLPKKFGFLWRKEKPTPIEEVRKVTAGKLLKKPKITLSPEDDLNKVLKKIIAMEDFIPVIENGKLIGIVREADVINFFLKELAKAEFVESQPTPPEPFRITTEMDNMLNLVKSRREISASEVSNELGLSLNTVERLAEIMRDHKLIRVKYSFFKGMVLLRRSNYDS